MSNRKVFFNDRFVDEKDARISIYDSALMFGDMVFEMTRSFNKQQFKLTEHIERLYQGVSILRIPLTMTKSELEEKCLETIQKNEPYFEDDDEHRLMINISRGPLGIYAPIFDNQISPTIVIADFPLRFTVSNFSRFFSEGINCIIPSQRAIPATLMDPKIKNRSRLFYQMANIEVSQYKGNNNWALLIDTDGYITEGTGDNFFIIKNGTVISPEGRNILRGISRDYIFQLCKELKIPYVEKNIEPFDVYDADEAFITGTPFCILPVVSLNQIKVADGHLGKITNQLLQKWSDNVGVNIVEQIKDWDLKYLKNQTNAPSPYQFK